MRIHGRTPRWWRRERLRRAAQALALSGACVAVAACGGSTDSGTNGSATSGGGQKKLDAVLLNNFMGNTWRPVMMQSADLLAARPPLDSRISNLKLVVTDNNATAQNAALNSTLLNKPDLVLIDAANATASNQTIDKVCKAGATVVSFDVNVTAPCAWKTGVDFQDMGVTAAKWMVKAIGGKGKIFLDLGQAGAKSAGDWASGARSVLDKHPGIAVKTYYGQFSEGAERAAVANLAATNPDVTGVMTHGYGPPAEEALKRAGHSYVPVTGFAYNSSALFCAREKVPCLLRSSPTWVSGSAMILGADVISGKQTGSPRFVPLKAPWYVGGDVQPETTYPVIQVSRAGDASLNGGIALPLSPPWTKLDATEVLQKPKIG